MEELADRYSLELEFRCDRNPFDPLTPDELEGVVAVIADLEKYDAELLRTVGRAYGGDLGLIARYGIGYSSVDIDAARAAGVTVANAPGANALPTAEWVVATLIDVAGRRMPHHQRAGSGRRKTGPSRLDITGKTLGIIGAGNVGKNVVDLMRGFEMNVLASANHPNVEWAREKNVTYMTNAEICERADFITVNASAKELLIGKKEISLMSPTTVLVNCARGALVDNPEVYKAVKEGKLWGYGIDEVWEYSDLPLDGLNIVASPHVGSDTDTGKVRMQLMSARAIIDFIEGKEPESVVNKA